MKFYRFQCSNDLVYEVPLDIIIRDKAKYALKQNWYPELTFDQCYDQIKHEFEKDYGEIEDWATNNMYWEDVKEFAKLVQSKEKKIDMEDEWCNPNEIKIVEHN